MECHLCVLITAQMSTLFVTTFFCAGKMRPLRVELRKSWQMGRGLEPRTIDPEDIQSYLLRFGVSGMFLGSKIYLLRRRLDVKGRYEWIANWSNFAIWHSRIYHLEWLHFCTPCDIHSYSWSRDLWGPIKRCSSTSKIVDFSNHACQEIFALLTLGERCLFLFSIGARQQMSNDKINHYLGY